MTNERILYRIIEEIQKVRETKMAAISSDKYENNGAVFYMNSNDGTMGDFTSNNRTCEFGVFYAADTYYAIKAWLTDEGNFEGFCYPSEATPRHMPAVALDCVPICYAEDTRSFADWLERTRDFESLWDEVIEVKEN